MSLPAHVPFVGVVHRVDVFLQAFMELRLQWAVPSRRS
jgi:hypothetical protein